MNMKINQIKYAAVAALTLFSLFSCKEDYGDPDLFLDMPEDEITVTYDGKNAVGDVPSVEIGSNTNWEMTDYPQWVTPSLLKSDRGRNKVFLTCEENLTGADRSGSVTVSGAGTEKTFTITQKLKVDVLSVNENSFDVKGSGLLPSGLSPEFYILDVNSDWTITADDWITASPASGSAGQYITVKLQVSENDTPSARTGEVKIIAGSKTETILVKQAVEGVNFDKTEINVNRLGLDDNASAAFLSLVASGEWAAEADSWIHLSQTSGEGGESAARLTVTVDENPSTVAYRTGTITFKIVSSGVRSSVTVTQSATDWSDINIFFQDDFSWMRPYIDAYNAVSDKPIGDSITEKTNANAPNVYSIAGGESLVKELNDRGYVDLRYIPKTYECLYPQDCYWKMGKTNYHTGFQLPSMRNLNGSANAVIEFDWCAGMTGSGNIDKVSLVVEISGNGTLTGDLAGDGKLSAPIAHTQAKKEWKWQHISIPVTGVDNNTVVKIRPLQMNLEPKQQPDQQRWFIDNISIKKAN